MKYFPGGSYIVLKITPRVPGDSSFTAMRYKYNYRNFLGFIVTEGDGSTEPCDPYLSCFPDIFSNASVHTAVLPHLIGRYFNACNLIENHNRIRQYELALNKYRVT